jgi:hypothetical protein
VNNTILNYDGGISTSPKQVAYPETVGEIQAILQDNAKISEPRAGDGKLPLIDSLRLFGWNYH